MTQEINTITLTGLPEFSVNCYLIRGEDGFVLIDTGLAKLRTELERQLEILGCSAGNLKLIIITHGDGDHTGNCAYLRKKFVARVAMHRGDSQLFGNKDASKPVLSRIFMGILSFVTGLGKTEDFKPDILLEDGDELEGYGLDAKVVHLPGHTKGSIGVLTANGDLFCGDLLMNTGKPVKPMRIDDKAEYNASIQQLKSLPIRTVYPGHGKPIPDGNVHYQ